MDSLIKQIKGDVGIYAENLNTGEQYQLNAEKIFSSASVIKLPILYLLYKQIADGKADKNHRLAFTEMDIVDDSPYFEENDLEQGYIDIYTATHSMITVSDNTSTNLMIDFLGMDKINTCIHQMGMNSTFLKRKMCDFEKRNQGIDNLTTACDMAKFFKHISPLIKDSPYNEMFRIITEQKDLEKIPSGFLNEKIIIANKPGELPGIRSDAALLIKNQTEIVISILTENVENEEETDIIIGKISKEIFEFLK